MDELEIDGKKYFSSRRAAREHKYHIDYIGQLIRAGKVAGKKVGRSWYVEETSLKTYLLAEGGQTPIQPVTAPTPLSKPELERESTFVQETPAIHPAFQVRPPVPVEEKKIEPAYVQPVIEQPVHKEERIVYFTSPVVEKKPSTLSYVEDDEPMLPTLNGRVRPNADFVTVPMRKIAQEEPEDQATVEEEIEQAHITVEKKRRHTLSAPRLQILAAIAVTVLAVATITSSIFATSIKVTDGAAASVGLTVK